MGNIMALDASTKATGWAIKAEDGSIKYGLITANNKDARDRILIMRDTISAIVNENNVDKIILEEVRPNNINDKTEEGNKFYMNNRTEQVLKWLQAAIVLDVFEKCSKNINVELIYPSSWRSVLGIQKYGVRREAYKRLDVEFANKTYNLNLSYGQDDEADALCILTAYLKNHNALVIKDEPPKVIEEDFDKRKSAF